MSLAVIFSLISSIGIAIGMIIIEANGKGADTVLVATCQGIAGGTILYVVMFEILNRERVKEVQGLVQLLAVMLGFVAMLLVCLCFSNKTPSERSLHIIMKLTI